MVFLLLLISAGLSSHHSKNQASRTTSPNGWTPESFTHAEFSGGLFPSHEPSNKIGMEKLAEMTALVRHNEICAEVPREWLSAFTVLLVTATPTEEQVVSQERKMLELREKIGDAKWCQLYSVEMQEAYAIYQYLTHR